MDAGFGEITMLSLIRSQSRLVCEQVEDESELRG